MEKLAQYLNPMARLGTRRYSTLFPLVTVTFAWVFSEFYAYFIAGDPDSVGSYAIFLFLALIIYFSFRDGIKGGLIVTCVTVLYYFYIIRTRNYTGEQLQVSIQLTLILASLYVLISLVIGWLKHQTDALIDQEANERRRLQAVIQQLPVGVIITDSTGRVERANRQVEALFSKPIPHGFMMGKTSFATILYHGKPVAPSDSSIMKVLKDDGKIVGKEFTVIKDDGKTVHIQVNASTIKDRRGHIIAAASIINDITAQKEMEERKDDFVNMASHELKTPLTSMKLYIESLFRHIGRYRDERALKTLTSIKYQTERLQELVNDLLDVSRLQTGKLIFHKEEFVFDELIAETIESLQGGTTMQDIRYEGNPALKVYADKFRISQVLTNLVTNAIKYSPVTSVINITLKKEKGRAVVSVADQGIGIAPDQQRKIFDRLYQVTDPTEKTFPGLGMGLYISKRIIRRHLGSIWVESRKGEGATFYFSLPLAKK